MAVDGVAVQFDAVDIYVFLNFKESMMKLQRNEQQQSYKDPVCGMEISRTTAIEEFVHQGKTYYFCSGACRETFETEPEKYIRQHRQ